MKDALFYVESYAFQPCFLRNNFLKKQSIVNNHWPAAWGCDIKNINEHNFKYSIVLHTKIILKEKLNVTRIFQQSDVKFEQACCTNA